MPFTTLVIDNLSGSDDSDIEGRVPDGGGDLTKAVGVWGKNTELFEEGELDAPDNIISLISNKLKHIGGDDFWDSVYTVRSIPGMTQDHWAKVTGRFHNLENESWFGVALRFHDTANQGLYIWLESDGQIRMGFSTPTTGFVIMRTITYLVEVEVDYAIVASINGATLRIHINDVDILCAPLTFLMEGNTGIDYTDLTGTGADISISHFSSGNGDPYEELGSGAIQYSIGHANDFHQVPESWGRFFLEWKPIIKKFIMRNGAWELFADYLSGAPVPTCGQRAPGAYRCLTGSGALVRGPDGAGLAQTRVDVTTDVKVESPSVYDGGEMIVDGFLTSGSTANLNKIFVPGALGGGVNVIDKTTHAVTGWPTPETPFGCAARGQRYYQEIGDWGYNIIAGAPRPEQPIGQRVYFVGETPASITVGPNTYFIDFGGVGGAMREFWNTECPDTLDFWGMPESEAFPNMLLGPGIAPSSPAFPGKASGDANSIYICNYLEISGDGTLGSTRFRYGVICAQRNPLLPRDIIHSSTDPGIPSAACESDAGDGDDLDLRIFIDVPNWFSEKEYLYVGAKNSGIVYAMDPASGGAIDYSFDTGLSETRGMAMAINSGDRLVVVGGGLAKCFDVGTNEEFWSTPVGNGPYFVYPEPFTTKIWISNVDDGTVTIINADDGSVIDTVATGSQPHQIVRHSNMNKMYVANTGDDTISVINPSTYVEEMQIAVLDQPWGLFYDQTRRVVWVGHAVVAHLLAT